MRFSARTYGYRSGRPIPPKPLARMIRRARSGADESPLSIVEIITGLNAYRDNAGKKEAEAAESGGRQLEFAVGKEIADLPMLMRRASPSNDTP